MIMVVWWLELSTGHHESSQFPGRPLHCIFLVSSSEVLGGVALCKQTRRVALCKQTRPSVLIFADKCPNFDSSSDDHVCCPRARRAVVVWAVRAHIPSRAFFTSRPSARRTADCHNQAVSQGCRSSDPPRQARAPATQPQTETDLPTRQNANLNCYLLESYSAWHLAVNFKSL